MFFDLCLQRRRYPLNIIIHRCIIRPEGKREIRSLSGLRSSCRNISLERIPGLSVAHGALNHLRISGEKSQIRPLCYNAPSIRNPKRKRHILELFSVALSYNRCLIKCHSGYVGAFDKNTLTHRLARVSGCRIFCIRGCKRICRYQKGTCGKGRRNQKFEKITFFHHNDHILWQNRNTFSPSQNALLLF